MDWEHNILNMLPFPSFFFLFKQNASPSNAFRTDPKSQPNQTDSPSILTSRENPKFDGKYTGKSTLQNHLEYCD